MATKVVTVLSNNITLTADEGEYNHTSNVGTLITGYGAGLYVKVTNGGTGPTVACKWKIQTSPDNSNWYDYGAGPYVAAATNSEVYSWGDLLLNISTGYVRILAGSNTDQNVTFRAEVLQVTAVRD